ncbi:MAG: TIGR04190 family B12-binding domain/radical SAM domain protein, partial [Thermofilum sp.]
LGEEEFSRIKASVEAARSGQHVKSFREKETLREDELYPKRKIPLQYMTLRLVGEIIRYAVTQA